MNVDQHRIYMGGNGKSSLNVENYIKIVGTNHTSFERGLDHIFDIVIGELSELNDKRETLRNKLSVLEGLATDVRLKERELAKKVIDEKRELNRKILFQAEINMANAYLGTR